MCYIVRRKLTRCFSILFSPELLSCLLLHLLFLGIFASVFLHSPPDSFPIIQVLQLVCGFKLRLSVGGLITLNSTRIPGFTLYPFSGILTNLNPFFRHPGELLHCGGPWSRRDGDMLGQVR